MEQVLIFIFHKLYTCAVSERKVLLISEYCYLYFSRDLQWRELCKGRFLKAAVFTLRIYFMEKQYCTVPKDAQFLYVTRIFAFEYLRV